MGRAARVACFLGAVAIGALPGAGAAQALSVEVSGPAVAGARVEHVIERSQGTLVVRVGKFMPDGFGRREAVGLFTDEDLADLVRDLDALGAFALPSLPRHGRRPPRAIYRVRLDVGERRHHFEVADPGRLPDGRHAAVIARLRAAVEGKTGQLPLQDDLLLPEEAGLVHVLTDVPARVLVVGQGFEGKAPVRGLRLPVGVHVLEVVPIDGGAANRYEIRVDAGRTTSLDLQLK